MLPEIFRYGFEAELFFMPHKFGHKEICLLIRKQNILLQSSDLGTMQCRLCTRLIKNSTFLFYSTGIQEAKLLSEAFPDVVHLSYIFS